MGNSESLGQFQEAIAGLKSNKVEKLYLAGTKEFILWLWGGAAKVQRVTHTFGHGSYIRTHSVGCVCDSSWSDPFRRHHHHAGNGIRAEGAARLAEALKHNNSLTALYLGGAQIGWHGDWCVYIYICPLALTPITTTMQGII